MFIYWVMGKYMSCNWDNKWYFVNLNVGNVIYYVFYLGRICFNKYGIL